METLPPILSVKPIISAIIYFILLVIADKKIGTDNGNPSPLCPSTCPLDMSNGHIVAIVSIGQNSQTYMHFYLKNKFSE